jgi:hypothetical protein
LFDIGLELRIRLVLALVIIDVETLLCTLPCTEKAFQDNDLQLNYSTFSEKAGQESTMQSAILNWLIGPDGKHPSKTKARSLRCRSEKKESFCVRDTGSRESM